MTAYKSAEKTLEQLCKEQPDQPVLYGLGKTVASAASGGLSALLGACAYYVTESIVLSSIGLGVQLLGGVVAVLSGGMALVFAGAALYAAADGLTSLAKPFVPDWIEGDFYYRNGGFMEKATRSDMEFGTRVWPVEHTSELEQYIGDTVLMNGVLVKDTDVSERQYMTMAGKVPIWHTEYTVNLRGTHKGHKVRAYTVTEDSGFASSLCDSVGDTIHMKGRVDKEQRMHINYFGSAK